MRTTKPLKLRIDRFVALADSAGARTDAERAALINVDRSTVTALRIGRQGPGAAFIDGCVHAFGVDQYHELFYREDS